MHSFEYSVMCATGHPHHAGDPAMEELLPIPSTPTSQRYSNGVSDAFPHTTTTTTTALCLTPQDINVWPLVDRKKYSTPGSEGTASCHRRSNAPPRSSFQASHFPCPFSGPSQAAMRSTVLLGGRGSQQSCGSSGTDHHRFSLYSGELFQGDGLGGSPECGVEDSEGGSPSDRQPDIEDAPRKSRHSTVFQLPVLGVTDDPPTTPLPILEGDEGDYTLPEEALLPKSVCAKTLVYSRNTISFSSTHPFPSDSMVPPSKGGRAPADCFSSLVDSHTREYVESTIEGEYDDERIDGEEEEEGQVMQMLDNFTMQSSPTRKKLAFDEDSSSHPFPPLNTLPLPTRASSFSAENCYENYYDRDEEDNFIGDEFLSGNSFADAPRTSRTSTAVGPLAGEGRSASMVLRPVPSQRSGLDLLNSRKRCLQEMQEEEEHEVGRGGTLFGGRRNSASGGLFRKRFKVDRYPQGGKVGGGGSSGDPLQQHHHHSGFAVSLTSSAYVTPLPEPVEEEEEGEGPNRTK